MASDSLLVLVVMGSNLVASDTLLVLVEMGSNLSVVLVAKLCEVVVDGVPRSHSSQAPLPSCDMNCSVHDVDRLQRIDGQQSG